MLCVSLLMLFFLKVHQKLYGLFCITLKYLCQISNESDNFCDRHCVTHSKNILNPAQGLNKFSAIINCKNEIIENVSMVNSCLLVFLLDIYISEARNQSAIVQVVEMFVYMRYVNKMHCRNSISGEINQSTTMNFTFNLQKT